MPDNRKDQSKRAARNESRKQDRLDAERRVKEQAIERKRETGLNVIPDPRPKDVMQFQEFADWMRGEIARVMGVSYDMRPKRIPKNGF